MEKYPTLCLVKALKDWKAIDHISREKERERASTLMELAALDDRRSLRKTDDGR